MSAGARTAEQPAGRHAIADTSRSGVLRWPQVPQRRRVEGLLWMVGGVVAAVLMTWPLARRLSTVVPHSTADPLAQAWHIAWTGHGLRTQPWSLYDGNTYWPDGPSLAFADSMLGYVPAALVGEGPVAALIRYNVLFLFAYALLFAAAGLLARELGLRLPASVVVAVGAAFSPTRTMQNNHLNILSVGGVVLTLFLLLSGYRRRRPWQVVAGWLTAAWQISIGFAMGIWFVYLLGLLALVAGISWWRLGRPAPERRLVLATVLGVGLLAAAVALLLQPYLTVIERYPQAQVRDLGIVEFFAPPPRGLLVAAPENRVWGPRTEAVRTHLPWQTEQTLFPGVAVVCLAIAGLRWRRMDRRVRIGLFVLGGFVLLLGFGPRLEGGILYEAFYRWAPGWNSIRTPGRLAFIWTVVLALLAGFGAERLHEHLTRRSTGRRPALPRAAVLATAAVLAVEGSVRLPLLEVPRPPVPLSTLAAPQLHLPSNFNVDPRYMLWSTDGFPRIANGAGSFDPPVLGRLRGLESFPDQASVDAMRKVGIRTVVVHREPAVGTPWEAAADRPVDGLDLTRQDLGAAVVFELTPSG